MLPDPATLLPWGHPGYRHPGPADVRAVVNLLGMTEDALATFVGAYDGSAVRCWLAPPGTRKAGAIRYPTWRLMLLEARLVRLAPRRQAGAKPLRQAKKEQVKTTYNEVSSREQGIRPGGTRAPIAGA